MSVIKKRYYCSGMAFDEKRGLVYTGGGNSHVFTFPEQEDIKTFSNVKQCSPYLSPQCTYVMFFNDPCYMYLYATDNLDECIYRGKFRPSSRHTACWMRDDCFLFGVDGTVKRLTIDKETKKVGLDDLVDLRASTGIPKLLIQSIDCFENKLLLYIERWIPGYNDCIVEIEGTGNMLFRELGCDLNGYWDARYDRRGGVFFSQPSKDIAWCKNIDHVESADRFIENTCSRYTSVSPDGKYMAIATRDRHGCNEKTIIIDTDTFSVKREFHFRIAQGGRPTFSSEGHYVLIGGRGAQIIDLQELEND